MASKSSQPAPPGPETTGARAAISEFLGCEPIDDLGLAAAPEPGPWPGYAEQLSAARERTGEQEAVVAAIARAGGAQAVVLSFDFRFIGGSLGAATGELIELAADEARRRRIPLISLTASGGARMQEGMHSLLQMHRVGSACARLRDAGVPHVSVVRHPTTGGVWASLAALADVIIGVPGATVAFSGPRVRGGDGGDPAAFTAEGKLADGAIDMLAEPEAIPALIADCMALLKARGDEPPDPAPVPAPLGLQVAPQTAWEAVEAARDPRRPRAGSYLDAYFSRRVALSGDRCCGRDEELLCGVGEHEGRPIAFIAQTGTANTPAGFRTAQRVLGLAERLGLPLLTLIDTPGADAGPRSEHEGLGTAIAELFAAMASPRTAITSVVIGEGGSGGAFALAGPGPMHFMPDSFFAVIAPEAAAAILHRDPGKARELAPQMRLTVAELVADGLGVAVEPED